jgi:transposase
MFGLTGLMRCYFIPGVTDMRCGYYRLSEIVRNQLCRNPYNGDVYIFMSKDRRKVKIIRFENNAYYLYEKCYVNGFSFMKLEFDSDENSVYKMEWKHLVALLECPVCKVLKVFKNNS